MSKMLKGLYAISDEVLTPMGTIEQNIEEALKSGVSIIQYRDKHSDYETLKQTAQVLQKLCDRYEALFVLNDHIELAIELGCDGLHIGKSDHEHLSSIRKEFGGVIGVSCYGDVAMAKEFERKGADYVAFGSFYTSKTKPNSNVISLEVLSEAKTKLSIPVCAIGGINIQNIAEVVQRGVAMISCIDAVFNGNIETNVKNLLKGME